MASSLNEELEEGEVPRAFSEGPITLEKLLPEWFTQRSSLPNDVPTDKPGLTAILLT